MPGEPWTHSEGVRVCQSRRGKSSFPGEGLCCFYHVRMKGKVGESPPPRAVMAGGWRPPLSLPVPAGGVAWARGHPGSCSAAG